MLPFKLVYSNDYHLPIGEHVFPSNKYRLIWQQLEKLGLADADDCLTPRPASDADVLLVHTPMYLNKLKTGTLSAREELELEVPYSPELVKAFMLQAGGSILAADYALNDGICIHIGGGFHHAFPDHGEGFCMLHDVAIAIRRMQQQGRIARAMTFDCDVHQGNGTALIFGHGEVEPFPLPSASSVVVAGPHKPASMNQTAPKDVFTISLHQENNYPIWKPKSSIDVNLPDGTDDAQYLEWVDRALSQALQRFEPELLCYIAGADPYREDQLGGLSVSIDGLRKRDEYVLQTAKDAGIPVMVTFAGGYAINLQDTVEIHTNTIAAAARIFAS
jgi:acetoin utilization deacetylase AcuC-like enzyme